MGMFLCKQQYLIDGKQLISQLKKKCKNSFFYTYKYNFDKKSQEISTTLDWFYKSQSEIFNNQSF